MPGFSRPMALIMPAGVSVTRGARVAGPRVGGDGLGDVGGVREVGEVVAVVAPRVLQQVERARGVDQRVRRARWARAGRRDLGSARLAHGVTSSSLKTGPSLHTRSLPRAVSTTQPWHEPVPQAMCASSET